MSGKRFIWIVIAYGGAVLAAAILLWRLSQWGVHSLLLQAAWADIAATVIIFAFSVAFRNSSFYDAYWSVAPPLLLLYWCWHGAPELAVSAQIRLLLVSLLVLWWALRLTHNWGRSWQGLHDQDWRYRDLQEQLGWLYWPVSLLGIHLMPTVWVFLGALGLYAVSGAAQLDGVASGAVAGLGRLDLLAALVGIAAVWIEMRADRQLGSFRRARASSAELLRTGVWSWCRHPNYLGEIGFWMALALFGTAAVPDAWWVWLGPAAMLLLFISVSIPMIERKLAQSKPGYGAYQAQTPMLIPRLRF